jgi:hypothetical protein
MKAKFNVVSCTNRIVKTVVINVDPRHADLDEFDLCDAYYHDVTDAACVHNHICESCYDWAYRVKFDCFIGDDDGND